jgi:ribosomal protein S24E
MLLSLINMKIQNDIKNDLLGRREVTFVITHAGNPGFMGASKLVSEHFKADEDCIMVENVKGKFGMKTFLIKASIYTSKELKDESFKRLTKAKKAAA